MKNLSEKIARKQLRPVAEIISIGEELLIGHTINTNAAWIASELNLTGIRVAKIVTITDATMEILQSLHDSTRQSDIVILTGGLGPTRDDVTRDALCQYFKTSLVMNEIVLDDIEKFFKRKGLPLNDLNRRQALVPESATIIRNPFGTAPGLWFEQNGKVVVSLPGVPHEMKNMMETTIIPELSKKATFSHIVHKTVHTTGIGESFLAEILSDWEDQLPGNISLAYLPSPGIVKLRLTGMGPKKDAIEQSVRQEVEKLQKTIPQYIWGFDDDRIEEKVGKALMSRGMTLSTAESCTGGFVAHRITSVPGSSGYFRGSVVAYDNRVKTDLLSVPEETLRSHGAVSREVVEAMARNARKLFNTDFAIAVSGIAGPGGGTEGKPVGTVWIAVASESEVISNGFLFGDNRERNILRATVAALAMLLNAIEK